MEARRLAKVSVKPILTLEDLGLDRRAAWMKPAVAWRRFLKHKSFAGFSFQRAHCSSCWRPVIRSPADCTCSIGGTASSIGSILKTRSGRLQPG
jgi:hypothetical protein